MARTDAFEYADMLEIVRERPGALGITTATGYLREIEGCFDGGVCPLKLLGNTSERQWKRAKKEAESKLVYHTPGMDITTSQFDLVKLAGMQKLEDLVLPQHTLGTFDGITTTTRRDRDGDVLESKGAIIDPSGPVLWQHMPFELLGKHLLVLEQTNKRVVERNTLIDNAFGNDVMLYVEHGALRISHGFLPSKYEPLDMQDPWAGFHILEFEIMERSLVSVPSNPDAELLVYSRFQKSLRHPLIKAWGKAKYLARPAQGRGFDLRSGITQEQREYAVKLAQVQRGMPRQVGLGKSFEIESAEFEPASKFLQLAKDFIGCDIRDMHDGNAFAPRHKVGSFLCGLKDGWHEHRVRAVRNLESNNDERPPGYEVIQLNSKQRQDFLVDGIEFRESPEAGRFIVRYTPSWGGQSLRFLCERKNADVVTAGIDTAWELTKTVYNFLKGEAFALNGDFIERTNEDWADLFLEPANEKALKRVIKQLNDKQEKFANRGMLMMGPPGTGKTLSGRILRNQCKATFIWLSARDFWQSGGMGGVASAFEAAKEYAPSVLFFEDVDNWMSDYVVDLMKSEMDGIGRYKGVLTVLTTNFPQRMPEALIDRPGRFHDILEFDVPEASVRSKMLARWLPDASKAAAANAVARTEGMSGAHVYELAHFAKTICEQDELPVDEALSLAVAKVHEQRERITSIQLGGSNYRPGHRSVNSVNQPQLEFSHMAAKRKSAASKAAKPKPGEDSTPADDMDVCPKCEGKMEDGVCKDCGYESPNKGDDSKGIDDGHAEGEPTSVNECPQCGSRVDSETGKCVNPNCDYTLPEPYLVNKPHPNATGGGKAKGDNAAKSEDDAPNYGAGDEDENCGNCKHYQEGTCMLFNFATSASKVCDSWDAVPPPEQTNAGGKSASSQADGDDHACTCGGKAKPRASVTASTPGTKAGRILSKKNEGLIREARDDLKELAGQAELPRISLSLCKSALGNLNSVLDTLGSDTPEPAPKSSKPTSSKRKTLFDMVSNSIADYLANGGDDCHDVTKAIDLLGSVTQAIERRRQEKDFAELIGFCGV